MTLDSSVWLIHLSNQSHLKANDSHLDFTVVLILDKFYWYYILNDFTALLILQYLCLVQFFFNLMSQTMFGFGY